MHLFLLNTLIQKMGSAFCWMLLHSIWQGILLALCVTVTTRFTKNWKATARYNLACGMLIVFILLCLVTFAMSFVNSAINHADEPLTELDKNVRITIPYFLTDWLSMHQQFIFTGWLVFFCAKMMHTAGALWYNHRMLGKQVSTPDIYWLHVFNRLQDSLKITRAVTLLESGCVKIPVVIGHLKPVVLVPLGMFCSIPADQAEAIIVHELAHIRRNDWLINFCQHIAESIFFFHPAVLLVSAWIREEREHCCDEIAVNHTNNKEGLIAALIHFKQQAMYGACYQTAFPGQKNQLLKRVQYIIRRNNKMGSSAWLSLFFVCAILLVGGSSFLFLTESKPTDTGKLSVIPVINITKPVISTTNQTTAPAIKIITVKKTATLLPVTTPPENITAANESLRAAKEAAEMDMARAMKDQAVARLDQEKAMQDQAQASLDQQQAAKDQEQSMKDQQQALINKKEAERVRLQLHTNT